MVQYRSNACLPSQPVKTIGDTLTASNVTWAWYSELFDQALTYQTNASSLTSAQTSFFKANFQYHHQPFLYFDRFSDPESTDFKTHLKDEQRFFESLRTGTGLPSVSWVKPAADDDWHPNQNNPFNGQAKLRQYIDAIQASSYWNNSLVVITFDEHGGLWDHVCPYTGDHGGLDCVYQQ